MIGEGDTRGWYERVIREGDTITFFVNVCSLIYFFLLLQEFTLNTHTVNMNLVSILVSMNRLRILASPLLSGIDRLPYLRLYNFICIKNFNFPSEATEIESSQYHLLFSIIKHAGFLRTPSFRTLRTLPLVSYIHQKRMYSTS